MIKKRKNKEVIEKNKNIYYWMGKISDVLIYPIIIIALITTFTMFSAKMQNKIQMVFGYTIVKVLSGSMTASGFMKDHNVIIHKVDTDGLRENDIIAFYYYSDPFDSSVQSKKRITDYEELPFEDTNEIDYTKRKDKNYVEEVQKAKVYFHQIINVYMNSEGIRFFQTKGTSNNSADTYLIREDFVVGQYVNTPLFLREALSFCSTSTGMIILVIAPLTVLIAMQLLSLLEQISALVLERKVIAKKIRYDLDECISSNVGIEMRIFDKIYFYDVMDEEEKKDLHQYLWSYLIVSKRPNAKKLYNTATQANKLYSQSCEAYWEYWRTHSNKILAKKITESRAKAYLFKYQEKNGLLPPDKLPVNDKTKLPTYGRIDKLVTEKEKFKNLKI